MRKARMNQPTEHHVVASVDKRGDHPIVKVSPGKTGAGPTVRREIRTIGDLIQLGADVAYGPQR